MDGNGVFCRPGPTLDISGRKLCLPRAALCDDPSVNQCRLDCFQRLHEELPLSLEELEHVFDALDADGNGFLTPEEFTTGFSKF